MQEYLKLLQDEIEMSQKFDRLKNKDLNDAERQYYDEVGARVTQKLDAY